MAASHSLQVKWAWNSVSTDYCFREPPPTPEVLFRIDFPRKKAAGSSTCQNMFWKYVFIKDWTLLPPSLVQILWHVRKPPDPGLKWVKAFWQTLHSIGNTPIPECDFRQSPSRADRPLLPFPQLHKAGKSSHTYPKPTRKSAGPPLPKKIRTRAPHVWISKESPVLVFRSWCSVSKPAMQWRCTEMAIPCVNKGISLHFQKELHWEAEPELRSAQETIKPHWEEQRERGMQLRNLFFWSEWALPRHKDNSTWVKCSSTPIFMSP